LPRLSFYSYLDRDALSQGVGSTNSASILADIQQDSLVRYDGMFAQGLIRDIVVSHPPSFFSKLTPLFHHNVNPLVVDESERWAV